MAALQYIHYPGYAALIIRKDLPRLALAGGLIPKSHEWLTGSDAVWNHARRQWCFPVDDGPPATITFGYLARPLDKFRYASSEFQYIAFDELTDFQEEDYLFLFSRLRRVTKLRVPLRMRSASNPGGAGHLWVKQRFVERATEDCKNGPAVPMLRKQGRLFIPARIADNPALNESEYRETLLHLPPVDRERLMNGNWDVQEDAVFKEKWLRYYVEVNKQDELLAPSGEILATIPHGTCRRFITIDPAGTSEERNQESKGKAASWTVAQVWDQPRRELERFLILRHETRVRVGFDELIELVKQHYEEYRPERIWIEGEKLGHAVYDMLKYEYPIECLPTMQKDKKTRSGPLIMKMERGEIFLPKFETAWRPGFEAELLAWTGTDREVADQIDAAAYAAIVVHDGSPKTIKVKGIVHRS